MLFERDEQKNRINRTKHGVDFETAAPIFAIRIMYYSKTALMKKASSVGTLSVLPKTFRYW